MITFKQKGDFLKVTAYLNKLKSKKFMQILERYGSVGVAALESATPVDTGVTASSWYYKIENQNGSVSLSFFNSNINKGVPIAIILQYGHGTRNGGWVEGRDYINPALQPVFDKLSKDLWEEVKHV